MGFGAGRVVEVEKWGAVCFSGAHLGALFSWEILLEGGGVACACAETSCRVIALLWLEETLGIIESKRDLTLDIYNAGGF